MPLRQGKAKGVHHHQAIITGNVKGTYIRKRRRSKQWTLKWQQIHNCQQLSLKNKLNKQPEQEQIHRYGDQLEGYQLRGRTGENGGKGAGIKKHKFVGIN